MLLLFYPEKSSTFVYEIPAPFSSAHSIFLSISAIIVAYFFARAFLTRGSGTLVVLGSGSLVLGLGYLLSQVLGNAPFGGPIQLVGISSLVFLCSALFFGAFAVLSLVNRDFRLGKPSQALTASYIAGLGTVALSIWVVEAGLAPAFFVPKVGPTFLREEVYAVAIVLFLVSSAAMMKGFLGSGSVILYWFSMGLALVAVGLVSAFLGRFPGGPFSWLARLSVVLSGLYLLGAVRVAFRDTSKNR